LLTPQIGEPVSTDLLREIATLEYFAATLAGVPPAQLCLGHLVGVLAHPDRRLGAPQTPRRSSDYRPLP
jgi:hypothetical protein